MKNLNSILLFLFFPFIGFAQSLNGIYTGVLSNDSTTIRKDQSFEMALTEYKGKVYGYAYSTFIINDTLYYIVKRVKGKIDGDICEVEDDEVISHNFPNKPEKKVYVSYTLRRNRIDSTWTLDGNWKTNLTKKYYAISGKVDAKEEKDISKSKLYEHLGDLNLQNTIALEKPKETPQNKKPVDKKDSKDDLAKNNLKKDEKISSPIAKSENKSPEKNVVITEVKTEDTKQNSTVVNSLPIPEEKKEVFAKNNKPVEKMEIKNTTSNVVVKTQPDQNEKKDLAVINSKPVDKIPDNSNTKQETQLPNTKPVTPVNNQQNQDEKKNVAAVATNNNNKNQTTVKTQPVTTTDDKKLVSVPVGYQSTTSDKKNETSSTNSDKKLVSVPVGSQPNKNVESNTSEKRLVSVPVGSQQSQVEKKDLVTTTNDKKESETKSQPGFEFTEIRRTDRRLKPAATLVDSRVSVPSETIFFKSDSLSLALYDNGEVDGDTVSVIINDVMFIEKQGLKSSAFRKTFYVPQEESDSLLVVLFAENLGKYPPNTGLLQIKDGDEIFYVRFKADLNRNAAIVLRRKYK